MKKELIESARTMTIFNQKNMNKNKLIIAKPNKDKESDNVTINKMMYIMIDDLSCWEK